MNPRRLPPTSDYTTSTLKLFTRDKDTGRHRVTQTVLKGGYTAVERGEYYCWGQSSPGNHLYPCWGGEGGYSWAGLALLSDICEILIYILYIHLFCSVHITHRGLSQIHATACFVPADDPIKPSLGQLLHEARPRSFSEQGQSRVCTIYCPPVNDLKLRVNTALTSYCLNGSPM